MTELSNEDEWIRNHYDQTILQYELERLEQHCPVEFGITLRCLRRYAPNPSVVVDVGVGAGLYAAEFARRGSDIILADISHELLKASTARLTSLGLQERIRSVYRASAIDLGLIPSCSADALMLLGPLYHLRAPEDRTRAIEEAARILKPGGVLFAAGLNRIAFLRDHFRHGPERIRKDKDFCLTFLKSGDTNPTVTRPLGFAHFFSVDEFRLLFQPKFVEVALVGTESFASSCQHILTQQPKDIQEAWLDLVEETATTDEGICYSDHFLYVGQRANSES